MKIVTPAEMARIEKLDIDEGASEDEFMEHAGRGVATAALSFIKSHNLDSHIALLAGKGNNAGDAYVAGRFLLQRGYKVSAYQLASLDECTTLTQKNSTLFQEAGGVFLNETPKAGPLASNFDLILDGIFGTGFHGEAKGLYAKAILAANNSNVPILAIDIPSGLDGATGITGQACINASLTVFLQLPKVGFFLNNGWDQVGELFEVNFGLSVKALSSAKSTYSLVKESDAARLLPKIKRTRHKYQAGTVIGFAGSGKMQGAAKLSTLSALRGGAGMVYLAHLPEESIETAAEIVKVSLDSVNYSKATACYAGPGIGTDKQSKDALINFLSNVHAPIVLDADALTILSQLPKGALLTPHRAEMARLLGVKTPDTLTEDFLQSALRFARERDVYIVLKGAPTFILTPKGEVTIVTAGSPGMATAGSGDVLTGLLASLLSQGLDPLSAAKLGVYLHGIAGENAAKVKSPYCMIASDIIEEFPEAFWRLFSDS